MDRVRDAEHWAAVKEASEKKLLGMLSSFLV
jgi:hypothetical protein